MSAFEAIAKELKRVRRKNRILKKLVELRCDLRDCPLSVNPVEGWASPEGHAVAYGVDFSEGGFVVYGPSIKACQEIAAFYIQEKHRRTADCASRYAESGQLLRLEKIGCMLQGPGNSQCMCIGLMPDGLLVVSDRGAARYWGEGEVKDV